MAKLKREKVNPDNLFQKMQLMEQEITRLKVIAERVKKLETIVIHQASETQECWERVEDQDERIKQFAHKIHLVTNFETVKFRHNAEA